MHYLECYTQEIWVFCTRCRTVNRGPKNGRAIRVRLLGHPVFVIFVHICPDQNVFWYKSFAKVQFSYTFVPVTIFVRAYVIMTLQKSNPGILVLNLVSMFTGHSKLAICYQHKHHTGFHFETLRRVATP